MDWVKQQAVADLDGRTSSYLHAVGRATSNQPTNNTADDGHAGVASSGSATGAHDKVNDEQRGAARRGKQSHSPSKEEHTETMHDGATTLGGGPSKGADENGGTGTRAGPAQQPAFADLEPEWKSSATRHSPIDKPLTTPWRWFSYITFWYLNPICRIGAQRQLNSEDLYPIPSKEEARMLADRAERAWKEELTKKNGSLAVAYVRTFWRIWTFASLLLFVETLLQVAEPVMLGRIVRNLQNDGEPADAFKWAGGLISAIFVHVLLHHVAFMYSWRCGYQLMAATIGLIYRKALRINRHSFAQLTTGHVVNLVSNDVERFILFSVMCPYLYLGPIQTMIAAYFVWQQVGVFTLTGVGLYILLLPVNLFLGKAFASLRHRAAVLTDERVKVVNEVLSGMRVLKMYGWEKPFRHLVQDVRKRELGAIKRTNIIRGSNMAFFGASAVLTSFLTFITYQSVRGGLTAEKVFTTIAIFQAIRLNIAFFFPSGIQSFSELTVSFRRFERFLRLREHNGVQDSGNLSADERTYAGEDYALTLETEAELEALKEKHHAFVKINHLSATWKETPTLQDISLTATPGKLVAVVGPVGSGKSSLLMAILGELDPCAGAVHQRGSTGFASQEPWILNATIRDNILFGREYDKARFAHVVRVCQLTADLSAMPQGASTEIGERGVTLSGGQKARISLARALYADADVYLLDDPLSAVDAKVGRRLFDDCIRGSLKQKVCILVTHQLQFLREADELIVLGEDGGVLARGSFDELMSRDIGLAEVLKQIDHSAEETQEPQEEKGEDEYNQGTEDKLVDKEHRQEGIVRVSTYMQYVRAAVPYLLVAVLWVILCASTQALQLSADWFLSYWVELEEDKRNADRNTIIYSVLVALFTITCFARAITFMLGAARASEVLNDTAFSAVVATTVRFFDTNPIGRILNRFSKDMGFLDDLLPWTFFDLMQNIFLVLGIVLLVCSINPWLFLSVAPIAVGFRILQRYFLKTAREIKRIEATNRSPVYSHFSASLSGLATLRSQNALVPFIRLFERYQNEHGKAFMAFIMISRWLGVRLDLMTFSFTTITLFVSLALRDKLGAGEVGLAMSYVLQLTNIFQWVIRQSAEVENQMTSIERIVEYGKLQREEEFVSSPSEESADPAIMDKCAPATWPSQGKLEFKDLSLRYAPDTPLRLHSINCTIPPGAKVGIVGRTGAGKSSLLAALFRLAPTTGDILMDDVPSSKLPLHVLRRKIGVIPQDPVLFSGSVRYNLDPFAEYSDDQLWNALRLVQLDRAVSVLPGGLEEEMSEAGGNFSVGQRQLVCMARAILYNSHVLVMDEATANVDTETDRLIQQTIRTQFSECTVLTIAHRLHTIMDCDLIMVMDAGRLMEFAPPEKLIDEEGSLFHSLAQQARLNRDTVVDAASRRTSSVKFQSFKASLKARS